MNRHPELRERVERCLESVARYPLQIDSARECKLLKGFNDDVVAKLDEKLKAAKSSASSSGSEVMRNPRYIVVFLILLVPSCGSLLCYPNAWAD